jgi:translation initiation factor 2B subunit (eIF-2B alpha/beta/delta family)
MNAVGVGGKERKRTTSMQSSEQQVVDYTPPQYISLLFTDMGVLTASAASDELLRFFS